MSLSNYHMLAKEAIDELKQFYKEEYGKELPDDEAWKMGNRLIRLFDVLTRPKPRPEPAAGKEESQARPPEPPSQNEGLASDQMRLPL